MRKAKWNNLIKFIIQHSDEEELDVKIISKVLGKNSFKKSILVNGTTPIHFVTLGVSSSLCEYLLSETTAKDYINYINDNSESPLHWACQSGNIEIVKLLLFYGADISCLDNSGNSILHWAVSASQEKIVDYILHHLHCHKIIHCVNMDGHTALDIAIQNEDEFIVHLFQ